MKKSTLIVACLVAASSGFAAAPRILVGPDQGRVSTVNSYRPDGRSAGSFDAFPTSFSGGVRVAVGDIDGVSDLIVGAGPGGGPVVRVFSGADRTPVRSFNAYEANFTGGVFVAAGDVNGDGVADIITGAGAGAGGHVKVFSGRTDGALLASFFAFDTAFSGGVRVAAGDVNGDGRADIIVGAGSGANGHVKVFDGTTGAVLHNFFAFPQFTGGVHVSAGDVNGDGVDDVIVGAGSNGHVKVFSGKDQAQLRSFFAFQSTSTPSTTDGVRVAGTDLNRDGFADIVAATGPGSATTVRAFNGTNLDVMTTVTPYGTAANGAYVAAARRFLPVPLNIATRIKVLTGDNALIGGFIVRGTEPKRIIVRGIGPSSGVPGALADPTLELNSATGVVATNDNWKSEQQRDIEATGIPPTNDAEAAIVRTLAPGLYTAILRGKNDRTGIGLIETYDVGQDADGKLINISSRGFVGAGDDVLIGGFIVGGGSGVGSARVVARAIGPSLTAQGVPSALPDPTIELVNADGSVLQANDSWKSDQQATIQALGLQPGDDREAVLVALLLPGSYTAIVRGKGETTGVGLVEIYNVQ